MNRLLTSITGAAAILATLTFGLPAQPARAAFCTVDLAGGGTHVALQDAVDDLACTDIGVFPGLYVENVTINRDLTITGSGQANTIVDGGLSGPVFTITGGTAVSIARLTATNGSATNGGGILNLATLTLEHVSVSDNESFLPGGGVYNQGVMAAVDVTIDANVAFGFSHGGGVYNLGTLSLEDSRVSANGGFWGGGIANYGDLTLRNSLVDLNVASERGGGVFNNGQAELTGVVVLSNVAGEHGGGLYNYVTGEMAVAETRLQANWAETGGAIGNLGLLELSDSLVRENSAEYGGAMFHSDLYGGLAALFDSVVTGNAAAHNGGGILAARGLTIVNSTLSHNLAARGGGIDAAGVTLVNSTLHHNSAMTDGGGIFMSDSASSLIMDSSTVSLNTAGNHGGGIYLWDGTADLSNLTVTRNAADSVNDGVGDGGGLYQNAGTVTVRSSIVAANLDNSAAGVAPDCAGTFTSGGYNLVGDGTGCAGFTAGVNGDQVGSGVSPIDPRLGLLKDNGGPTWTHRLLAGSPALDTGSACPALDQRGLLRPVDGNNDGTIVCDIGALEHQ